MSEQRRGKVFCVGLAIQDTIFSVDDIPREPVKVYARERRDVGGGPAATAAVAIARLGGRATIAARIGADATGNAISDELSAEGIDTTWLRVFDDNRSPGAVILVDRHGERLIVAYVDPDTPTDADWLRPETLGGALLCDLSWPHGSLACLEQAKREGIPSVLDAEITRHPRELVEPIIAGCDHVVFSRPGLAQFTGADSIEEGLRRARRPGHKIVGVTDGSDGLYWLDGDVLRNARAPHVDVVDTVGAGDAFHGAFALAMSHGRSLEEAIRFANSVAALKCTVPGGRAGLPTPQALLRFDPTLDLDWIAVR
ncbi:PfkB family carbohydrate kinase [Mesorhizobium sp. CAU 1741]|uniref:PfkB family carbohydrate kinase n=1 Tax=Mesorhizobium sp. CAU 1741 TaxID=3140366 RepID=UPI00325ADF41